MVGARLVVLLVAFALSVAPLRAVAADRIAVTQYGIVLASLPWAVALNRGMMSKRGLDIDGFVGSNGGGTSIRNIIASGIPFGEVATAAAVAGVRSGLKLKILYSAVNNTGDLNWMVLKGAPYKSLADLAGRKLGYDSPQGATDMDIRLVLQRANVKDVQLIVTGGSGAGVTALESGGIDAVPFPNDAVPERARVLFNVTQFVPKLNWEVGVTTEEFARQHGDMLRKLIAARREAVDFIYANPTEAAKIYAQVWNVSPEVATAIVNSAIRKNYWSRGDFDRTGLETIMQGIKLADPSAAPVDVNALLDKSFLPADLRR